MTHILLAAGYLNVDIIASLARVPGFGERTTASSVSRSFGGMTANAACAAARLGLRTEFFGKVGRDPEGDAALAELSRFGVGTSWMSRTAAPTTTALVLLSPDGERAIVSQPMTFDYAPLDEALGVHAGDDACVHVDGYRLPEAAGLLRNARKLGFRTSADLDGIEDLEAHAREILSSLDLVVLNGRLADTLAANPEEAAGLLAGWGGRLVIVTLGREGVLLAEAGQLLRMRPPPVPVRDTTGAGDAFMGAFLAVWLGGAGAEEAGRLAVAVGAISVGAAGARGGLPGREDAERLARRVTVDRKRISERSWA